MTDIILDIDLDLIDALPYAMRQSHGDDPWGEGVGDLAASMRRDGQLQPVMVCLKENLSNSHLQTECGYAFRCGFPVAASLSRFHEPVYDLVFGHRRVEAARQNGFNTVKALVRPRPACASDLLSLALAENVRRQDISPTERAVAEARLKAAMVAEGKVSSRGPGEQKRPGETVAAGLPSYGRLRSRETRDSERTIENRVALGEAHPDVRHAVDTRVLLESGGYSLARFDPQVQAAVVEDLLASGVERAGPEEVHTAAVSAARRLGVAINRSGEVYEPRPHRVTMAVERERLWRVARAARVAADNPGQPEAWRAVLSDALTLLEGEAT